VTCNTSAEQYVSLELAGGLLSPLNRRIIDDLEFLATAQALNLSSTLRWWTLAQFFVLDIIAPFGDPSIFLPSCERNNLSSIELFYNSNYGLLGNLNESINTPADDHWTLEIRYSFINETVDKYLPIVFLPTGEIDFSRTQTADFAAANSLLAPTFSLLRAQAGSAQLNPWKFINWLFVSVYWTTLNEFGHTSPTPYVFLDTRAGSHPDFSRPIQFLPINNIFVNTTLFDIYSSYLRDTILPLLNYSSLEFAGLDSVNRLEQTERTFLRSYSCVQRTKKANITFIFSVFAVVYAFVSGGYTLVMLVAGALQSGKENGSSLCLIELTCR
jgi:hypothetical protein